MVDSLCESQEMRAGCLSNTQVSVLHSLLESKNVDPSLLSDLEGCGPVSELEKAICCISGAKYTLAVSSCTAALHAALLASGIGPGDEVIVSPYSWPQSVSPVIFTGATPVFADINEKTFNIDVNSVKRVMSDKTRAIIVVHMFGHMADMRAFRDLASDTGVTLIADAAHALCARLHGVESGAWADVTCYSFGRGKLVSGGEGGALVTDCKDIYEKSIQLTQHEERSKRMRAASKRIFTFSLNYRIHPLGAVLALADLKAVNVKLKHRQEVIDSFQSGLGQVDTLSGQTAIIGDSPEPYGIPLTMSSSGNRERLVYLVQQKGIPLRMGPVQIPLHLRMSTQYYPPHIEHFTYKPGTCPIAEERCLKRELFALSALDMDAISPDNAHFMGRLLKEAADELYRAEF